MNKSVVELTFYPGFPFPRGAAIRWNGAVERMTSVWRSFVTPQQIAALTVLLLFHRRHVPPFGSPDFVEPCSARTGKGYQTLINEALAQNVNGAEPPVTASQVRNILREELEKA